MIYLKLTHPQMKMYKLFKASDFIITGMGWKIRFGNNYLTSQGWDACTYITEESYRKLMRRRQLGTLTYEMVKDWPTLNWWNI